MIFIDLKIHWNVIEKNDRKGKGKTQENLENDEAKTFDGKNETNGSIISDQNVIRNRNESIESIEEDLAVLYMRTRRL